MIYAFFGMGMSPNKRARQQPSNASVGRLDVRGGLCLNQRLLALWAADCAEHVLPLFEQMHPQDNRPRQAIEAARAWARGEIAGGATRAAAVAAHAAARTADEGAARAVARAAGHAAGTAPMLGHAQHAAAYAVKAVFAAEADSATEREWQRRRLPKNLRRMI